MYNVVGHLMSYISFFSGSILFLTMSCRHLIQSMGLVLYSSGTNLADQGCFYRHCVVL